MFSDVALSYTNTITELTFRPGIYIILWQMGLVESFVETGPTKLYCQSYSITLFIEMFAFRRIVFESDISKKYPAFTFRFVFV